MEKLRKISIRFEELSEFKKIALLANLVFYFSQAARGSYIEAGNKKDVCISNLRAYNEIMQSISDKLIFQINEKQGSQTYSTEIFFQILKENFNNGLEDKDYFFSIINNCFRQVG